ncbi:hypothetical protein GH714_017633 [Hevea brasiliensis]|uniref:DNA repair RAD52-like protein 1, mitochondrial n=1 Tax=Hevea brasiliensis TaxID=3981 RepID=A0A6A6MAV8_HEVBR|nr:hypothetical protein GH714_017633 [Hevea brasiliensis]
MSTMKMKLLTARSLSSQSPLKLKQSSLVLLKLSYSSNPYSSFSSFGETERPTETESNDVLTSGISRPLSEVLKELNKRVPDSVVRERREDGFSVKYIPWHMVNRIMNLHAPEWSGEVRNITYSADGKSVSVVYRVTLYGTDAEVSYFVNRFFVIVA